MEDEERFFHYRPAIVAAAGPAAPAPSPAWNSVRERHSTGLARVENATVFGACFVGDPEGRCHCDTQMFRAGAFEFYDAHLKAAHPGAHPRFAWDATQDRLDIVWTQPPTVVELEAPVTLLTPIEPDNWARWLVQILPRLIQARDAGAPQRFLVRARSPWQRALLAFLGATDEAVIDHDPGLVYRARDLTFFQSSVTDLTVSRREWEIGRDVRSRCVKAAGGGYPERIFVSRLSAAKRHPHYRVLQNEVELIAGMEALGYAVVEPELLSFEEQVRIFARARVVACLGGAALFNTLFCDERAKVITIESQPTFITSHTGFLASMGLWHGVIFGEPIDPQTTDPHAPWRVDIDTVLQTLAAVG